VMNSKHIRGDYNLAWVTAEIAVMGAKGAVEILFRKELERAENKEERARQLEEEYNNQFAHPYRAAERGYVDDVIIPSHTRRRLVRALKRLSSKRDANPPKKHGNIPL